MIKQGGEAIPKLARFWDKFLEWLWWPAVEEVIEAKKKKEANEGC